MNDPEIRALLRPLLSGGVQIEELPCGSTRADLVHVHPDFMHGYELKGTNDSLKRAQNQLYCYSRAYDLVTFVVTPIHLVGLLAILPKWVGIMIAEPDGITPYRPAGYNPQMSRAYVISLLRQAEVKQFLKGRGMVGHSKKRDWELIDVLKDADHIPLAEVAAYTRERLVARLGDRMKQREILREASKRDRESAKQHKVEQAENLARMAMNFGATIEGFAGYRVAEVAGELLIWHIPGPDAAGHQRAQKRLRIANNTGVAGVYLRRNGCCIWMNLAKLRGLLYAGV